MGFLIVVVIISAFLVLLDYYVYRNWRRFARRRRGLRRTVPVYLVIMVLMPVVMPLFFLMTNWWEVDQRILRGAVVGFWLFWYGPKILIGAVLAIKDLARFSLSLFAWFKQKLKPKETGSEEETPDLSDMRRMSRSEFLQKIGWTAATVPFVIVGYGMFRTLYNFHVRRVQIPILNLPRQLEGLTIAQISDLHAGSFFSPRPIQEVAQMILDLRPDMITMTGDYVNTDHEEFDTIREAVESLDAELGVFACLGNHDHYARVRRVAGYIRDAGIELLVNEHRTLEIDGAYLHMIGTDNTGFRQDYGDLPRAVEGMRRHEHGDDVQILLAHDPSFWDIHVRPDFPDLDLTLSGHTHGGQIGFELGPMRMGLSRVAYERWIGLYTEPAETERRRQMLYVNRGIGTVGPPVRIGIRPEITLHRLVRAT